MLDVKRLTLLRDLADHGTITAVAQLHRITTSAVSQQLRTLEAESGVELLLREGRTVRLTAAGVALAAECEHILVALERAHSTVQALSDQVAGEFVIGTFASALRSIVTPLAVVLRDLYPQLRLRIVEAEPEESLSLLKRRHLDLAVIYRYGQLGSAPPGGLTVRPLFADPLALAVPENLRSQVEKGGLAALQDGSWISTPDLGPCRQILVHTCRTAGFSPVVAHTCRDLQAALALVSAGLGVMVLPTLLCSDPPTGIAILTLPGAGRAVEAAVRSGAETHPRVRAALAALATVTSGSGPLGGPECPVELHTM